MKIKFRATLLSKIKCMPFVIMRSFIFFFCTTVFSFSTGNLLSQNVKITIDADKTVTVVEVLDMIDRQTEYSFVYRPDLLNNLPTVKLKKGTIRVNELLKRSLAAGNFDIVINKNDTIFIKEQSLKKLPPSQKSINGKVSDETGQPLPGANVIEKNTVNGTTTDFDGKYSIKITTGDNAVLVFSYVGYKTQEITVSDQTTINVQMVQDAGQLDEVVVIGYGQTQAEKLTTSIKKIDLGEASKQAVTSFEQVLAGQAPGVTITQTTGAPGGNISVRVRGIGSISNNHEPLYVVDGVPLDNDLQGSTGRNSTLEQNTNPLSTINPQDIASISILKDAAAAAIYGSRAANGVVIITTKNGSGKQTSISYNTYMGIQSVLKKVDVLDAYEYAQLSADGNNAQYIFRNPDASITDPNGIRGNSSWQNAPELFPYLSGVQGLTDTDWQDEVFRNALIQNHNVSISGGLSSGNYYASLNYLEQEGIVIGSKFERYTARLKYNTSSENKLKFGINFSPSFTDNNLVSSEGPWWQEGIISASQVYAPIFPVYNSDGTFNFGNNNWGFGHTNQLNPVAMARLNKDRKQQFRLLGNAYLSYDFLKNFTYKISLGGDINFFKRDTYRPSTLETRGRIGPSEAFGRSRSEIVTNYTIEHTLNYDKRLNKHGINALLGFSAQKNRVERNFVRGTGFPNDLVETLNAASVIESGFSNGSEWSLLSYFGRVQYDYDAKYLLSASIRADGSSRFAPNNKWGYFPSAAIGWVVSKEDFLNDSKIVNNLKLRTSYGESGNFDIGNYAFIATLADDNYVFGDGDGEIVTGLRPGNLGNDQLAWESQNMFNAGLDATLFSGGLNLTFDYYRAINEDFLFSVPIPAASGFSSILENKGKIENKGFEVTLGTDLEFGDLKLSASVNASTNNNEVLELDGNSERIITSGSVSGATYLTEVGQPLGSYFLYKTDGVYLNQADVDNSPSHPDARPGDVKYVDVNGDGLISPDDRTVVGNYLPDYTFGGNLRLEYKGLDLSATMAGSQGNEILNLHRRYTYNITGNFNQLQGAVNRWRSENDPGDGFTVSAKTSTGRQGDISTRHIEDGSYIKIQNITLGYTFPKEVVDRLGIKRLRLYGSAQNPFLWTDYSGYNPEVNNRPNSATSPGEDYGSYPLAKVFSLGLDVSF